ncbi:MAG: hydrogenase maturation nickel metallochaperone HypA [DPANN group archaeon]|nr:hydrogenase maturation nickel metallochaperone HypA [DPANN group archaeon]
MHEIAFAEKIIKEARKYGDVEAIHLEIGELAHVPGKDLVEALRKMVSWRIEWHEVPAKATCSCGFIGHPTILERGHDHFLIECPECKSMPDLISGTDIRIQSVEVKD